MFQVNVKIFPLSSLLNFISQVVIDPTDLKEREKTLQICSKGDPNNFSITQWPGRENFDVFYFFVRHIE